MGKHKYKRNRWKFQSNRMMQSFFLKFYYHSFTHFPPTPLLDTATIISCWDDSNHFLTDLHASSPVQPQSVLNTARVIMEITGWILSLFCSEVSNGFPSHTEWKKKSSYSSLYDHGQAECCFHPDIMSFCTLPCSLCSSHTSLLALLQMSWDASTSKSLDSLLPLPRSLFCKIGSLLKHLPDHAI